MKKIILITLVLISFKGFSQSKTTEPSNVYFEVNDAKNRIVICSQSQHLDDLKKTIEKLYKEKSITLAGKKVVWEKGYPMWVPFRSVGPGHNVQKLFFAYVTKISSNTYYVKGGDKETHYYPYNLK